MKPRKRYIKYSFGVCAISVMALIAFCHSRSDPSPRSIILFRNAATGWEMNPDEFSFVGKHSLPHQATDFTWVRREKGKDYMIEVFPEEDFVCMMYKEHDAVRWNQFGCREVVLDF